MVIAAALLGGAGYVLALNGTRVPLLYTMVSGLRSSAKAAAAEALQYMEAQDSYTFANEVTLSTAPVSASEPPALPSGSQAASKFFSFKATAEGAFYRKDNKGSIHASSISIDSGASLPVASRVTKEDGDTWQLYFPDSLDAKVVGVDRAELKRTVLFPLIHPIPLEALLKAVSATRTTQKRQSVGRVVTAYAVSYDSNALKNYLPEGATVEDLEGTIELAWKAPDQVAGQPVGALLKGTLKFAGREYQLREIWNVGLWNTTLDSTRFVYLPSLLDDGVASLAPKITTQDASAQLGISDFTGLPKFTGEVTEPTPTPTAPGTSSTEGPATPTGEKITELQSTITASPPIPLQPANDAAKTRDTQRKQDLALLQAALERYKKDKGQYPVSQGVEQTLSSKVLFNALYPTYLTGMPVDPLPNTYWYEFESTATTFSVRAVLENMSDPTGRRGGAYVFYEVRNQ